ncbi:MAG TPA: SCO1664 family protein [Acidimicrobiia bacterium]|jgi:uncharacterized repeat protein (TIGR03843 family)|nr:SCO1664 family protein [Acidimicrobiia bacterium]
MPDWKPHVVTVEGRFVNASNATLLGTTDSGERVVYKPVAGERPLWDFESETLAVREVLTFEVDLCLGFGLVPETALGDGLYGPGSIQRYVDIDEAFDPYELVRQDDAALWPIAVLDVITNNADRKLGHILRSGSGSLVAIDHGLTFHPEDKLRTVLWGFAGSPAPAPVVEAVARLRDGLNGELGRRVERLLGRRTSRRLVQRTEAFLMRPVHPQPPEDRPALPWPPY